MEQCDFIAKMELFGRESTMVYRLVDFYTLFYFKFVEKNLSRDDQWWTHHLESSSIHSWMGFTFELICMLHHAQI